MAPGRKRGAKGLKTASELNLGDLVLAKVKGFPAWPAKISKPEQWKLARDPKKYFVQFFGTEEIAFVAPADIQAFTSEVKDKLLARCQGKPVKHFAQAVKEICEVFDQKSSGVIRDDTQKHNLGAEAPVDRVINDASEVDEPVGETHLKDQARRSQRQDDKESQDIRPFGDVKDNQSMGVSPTKRNKLSGDNANILGDVSHAHEGSCDKSNEENSEGTPCHGGESNQLPGTGVFSSLSSTDDLKHGVGNRKELTNGHEREFSKQKTDGATQGVNFSGSAGKSTKDVLKPRLHVYNEKVVKQMKNKKQTLKPVDSIVDPKEGFDKTKREPSGKKSGVQHPQNKDSSHVAEAAFSAVRSDDVVVDVAKTDTTTSHNANGPDAKEGDLDFKRSAARGKVENSLSSRVHSSTVSSNNSGDEDVLPPLKRRRRALEAMSSSENVKSPMPQLPAKRRAVRLCDDDDEEPKPKTPIHGGSIKKDSADRISDAKKNNNHVSTSTHGQLSNTVPLEKRSSNEVLLAKKPPGEASVPSPQQSVDKKPKKANLVSHSSGKFESEKMSSKEDKHVLVSPKKSTQSVTAAKSVVELHKGHAQSIKSAGQKTPGRSNGGFAGAPYAPGSPVNKSVDEVTKFFASGDRQIATPRPSSSNISPSAKEGNAVESIRLTGERVEAGRNDRAGIAADSKFLDPAMSMKHLIAAAQAKRKQAHSQNSHDNIIVMASNDGPGKSPVPAPTSLPLGSGSISVQQDFEGSNIHVNPTSDVHQFLSMGQPDSEELEERRVSSGHWGHSLSGDTEAAVARDAIEGMIETLSRTKESIGRATRLAIDCAKYGIANEVVELLIRKLENEPSSHRKVDLFFLVDSITQCSHSQKGIAGASYIPIVQAALPRLLGAAAPSGSSARENRRQCLKVLRLWLERKILPEPVLRRYMDDIGVVNDDPSAGFTLRRPSRAERAIDDPIREMEGMLVDEYGSNASIQLSGFMSTHLFEEEEEDDADIVNTSPMGASISPSEHIQSVGERDPDNHAATPSERRHCILEDVDCELEMEDVSGQPRDERPISADGSHKFESSQLVIGRISGQVSISSYEWSPLVGSPPMPPNSPPPTPPLPSSPPPPPSSTLPPPPPPSPPPSLPPPPPPVMHTHEPASLIVGPHSAMHPQISVPPQLPAAPQQLNPLPVLLASSSTMPYQLPHPPHETGSAPNGNHVVHIGANASCHGPQMDASARSEAVLQQAHSVIPAGFGNSSGQSQFNLPRPLEYRHNDPYVNPQASMPVQQFTPYNADYSQRPLHTNPVPQNPTGHFSYLKQPHQQHSQPPYPPPLPSNHPDGTRRYGDEQWRMPSNQMWVQSGRSSSGQPSAQEGYFRLPPERPLIGFQPPLNGLPAVPPIQGNGMISGSDMSINWRPV